MEAAAGKEGVSCTTQGRLILSYLPANIISIWLGLLPGLSRGCGGCYRGRMRRRVSAEQHRGASFSATCLQILLVG